MEEIESEDDVFGNFEIQNHVYHRGYGFGIQACFLLPLLWL